MKRQHRYILEFTFNQPPQTATIYFRADSKKAAARAGEKLFREHMAKPDVRPPFRAGVYRLEFVAAGSFENVPT